MQFCVMLILQQFLSSCMNVEKWPFLIRVSENRNFVGDKNNNGYDLISILGNTIGSINEEVRVFTIKIGFCWGFTEKIGKIDVV